MFAGVRRAEEFPIRFRIEEDYLYPCAMAGRNDASKRERIVGIVKIVAREEIGISNSARMDGWMGLARSHSFEVTSVDVASSANDCNLVIW